MAYMAKDKIVRTGTDINLATVVDLQSTAITTAQTGVAMTSDNRLVKVVKVALAASDAGGGVFAWANPEAGSIFVTRVVIDVTTQSTGACTVDVGTTATSAATVSDNLIDGVSVATAGVIDNALAATLGTNGKPSQKLASGKWVTASKATGATAGLVGSAYIYYVLA